MSATQRMRAPSLSMTSTRSLGPARDRDEGLSGQYETTEEHHSPALERDAIDGQYQEYREADDARADMVCPTSGTPSSPSLQQQR